ncbi:MAG TPA: thioredoxin family protein [Phycisphaerae bacterium]|nr:thioredoxin family protein [Phycisphaerae bacterium]HRY68523.1 thioredoxin family protein [Phycisphaerae bacterium]
MDWQTAFEVGLDYRTFLEVHGAASHRDRWQAIYRRVDLSPSQLALLGGFARRMNVLCLAGTWCGDCASQCPILQRFAEATDAIALRFLDRDQHLDIQSRLTINGGQRVPVVVFLSEDFHECGRYGERTISKYRELARTLTGAACPTGIGSNDETLPASVTAEWLTEFERIQLMLRLSPRLRQLHGD